MLALTTGILCADLLAVDALHGETLLPRQITVFRHGRTRSSVSYLVFLLGPELDKRGVHVVQRRRGDARRAPLLHLLGLGRPSRPGLSARRGG